MPDAESTGGPPRARLARWLSAAQGALGLAFVASWLVFAFRDRYRVPYRDDWDWLRGAIDNGLSFRTLLLRNNEHLNPLVRLLHAIQYQIEGPGAWLLFGVAVLAQLAVAWMFWREIRRRWPSDLHTTALLAGATAACLFFAYPLQAFVHMANVMFPLVHACTLAGVIALLNAGGRGRPWHRGWLAAAGLAALAAAATATNGFVVPWLLAALAWVRGGSRRTVALFVLAGALAVLTYVLLVGLPWGRSSGALPGEMPSAGAIAVFFFSFLSSPLAYATVTGSVLAGAVLAAAGAFVLWQVATRRSVERIELFAAGVMTFTFVSDAMVASVRAWHGPVDAAEPRYTTLALAFDAALTLWCASRLDIARARAGVRLSIHAAAVGALVVLVPAQIFMGVVWKAKADNVAAVGLAVAADAHDDQWIATLHPLVSHVYDTAARLRAAGRRDLVAPHFGERLSPPGGLPPCGTAITAVAAPSGVAWRLGGVLSPGAASALTVGRSGLVNGVVALAPLVAIPNPTQMDVIAAVWRSIAHPHVSERRAIGFASGAPVTFYGVGSDNALVCTGVVQM